jgi:hypothetical protein
VVTLSPLLSWSHFIELIGLEDILGSSIPRCASQSIGVLFIKKRSWAEDKASNACR